MIRPPCIKRLKSRNFGNKSSKGMYHHVPKDIEKDLNEWHEAYEKIWENSDKLEKLLLGGK